jgi:hypothetical protein
MQQSLIRDSLYGREPPQPSVRYATSVSCSEQLNVFWIDCCPVPSPATVTAFRVRLSETASMVTEHTPTIQWTE